MAQSRKKSTEQAQEPSGDIDWANVASEAAAMVELNKGATASWQGQQPEEEHR